MIKQLPLETIENLAQTIQTSIQLGHVPAQWKTTTVTMILKVGKDHKTLDKKIQTIIINILTWKTVRKHCKRTLGKSL